MAGRPERLRPRRSPRRGDAGSGRLIGGGPDAERAGGGWAGRRLAGRGLFVGLDRLRGLRAYLSCSEWASSATEAGSSASDPSAGAVSLFTAVNSSAGAADRSPVSAAPAGSLFTAVIRVSLLSVDVAGSEAGARPWRPEGSIDLSPVGQQPGPAPARTSLRSGRRARGVTASARRPVGFPPIVMSVLWVWGFRCSACCGQGFEWGPARGTEARVELNFRPSQRS